MKKILVLLTAMTLVGGLLSTSAVNAQEAPATVVPEVVNIEDPFGDANTQSGDVVGPADASSVGDIGKVWFTNTATTISVHFLTEAPAPASGYGLHYRLTALPDAEGTNCLVMRGIVAGGAFVGTNIAKIFDACNDGTNFFDNGQEGEIAVEETADGNGITTMTFVREGYTQLLAAGATVTAPWAQTDLVVGSGDAAFQAIRLDDTAVGTDYPISEGGPSVEPGDPPVVDPPPVDPPVKKKKKKKKCRAFVPGEMGAEAETVKVTDAHTAEAPLIVPVTLGQDFDEGIQGDPPTHTVNVQVDPKAKSTGLYATFEFPARRDYDLWAFYPTGEEAASSHGFSPLIETQGAPAVGPVNLDQSNTASNHAGETKVDSENIVGVITPDCGGYTMQVQNFFGEGGDFELKLFLGEGKTAPKEIAPEEEGGFPTASRLGLGALFSLL